MDQLGEGKSGSALERQLPKQLAEAQNILRVEYFGLQSQISRSDQVNKRRAEQAPTPPSEL
jgi:hypothetical protein